MINLLDNSLYTVKPYKKGEVLVHESDEIKYVGIVLSGELLITSYTKVGTSFEIQTLKENMIFGDSLAINHVDFYPGTIEAIKDSKVLLIKKDDFINLLKTNYEFLESYLSYVSKRNIDQQYKIKLLSQPSIREKILFFIKSEMFKQKSKTIKLNMTKENLAILLSLNRPSLSRELMRMRDDKLITYNKNSITYLG